MPEYLFRGSLKMRGVVFFIEAENEAEAKKIAASGRYDDFDDNGAETVDWSIDEDTCKENK